MIMFFLRLPLTQVKFCFYIKKHYQVLVIKQAEIEFTIDLKKTTARSLINFTRIGKKYVNF